MQIVPGTFLDRLHRLPSALLRIVMEFVPPELPQVCVCVCVYNSGHRNTPSTPQQDAGRSSCLQRTRWRCLDCFECAMRWLLPAGRVKSWTLPATPNVEGFATDIHEWLVRYQIGRQEIYKVYRQHRMYLEIWIDAVEYGVCVACQPHNMRHPTQHRRSTAQTALLQSVGRQHQNPGVVRPQRAAAA